MDEESLFAAAVEKSSPSERAAFLDQACAGDRKLRAQVEALLRAHDNPDSFLERPIVGDQETQLLAAETDRDDLPGVSGPGRAEVSLDFLEPCDAPGRLGKLGPYEVIDVLGRGGMGLVLKAHDPKLNRIVAIKTLASELAANPTARKRFLREAQAAAAVSHPHVVTIHAVDEAGNTPYLVMECIDGVTLQEKIDRVGTLELREILRIGAQTAAGLAAAHAQGLIHRDVKPGNILLENSVERVRVSDFGLARAADDVGMTRTGEVAGTPQHMSPEQAQGQPLDQRSDLFSLGSVLYAMCTGRSPFRADTALATMRRVCDDTPRPIREVNQDIPEGLAAIIDRLLAKDPDDRFQTAQEVADLLGRYLAHLQHPTSTPPPEVPGIRQPADTTLAVAPRVVAGRRWPRRAVLTAATVLVGLCISVAITEATGITNLAATVIRIATGEGTLVIEVDDPTVQVSLDGEELSITGAGIRELKLRPGQYQLRAIKGGQPVKQELVNVTRGDRQLVRVTREPVDKGPPSQGVTERAPFPGAFVVLRTDGVEVRKYDTLAEAVVGSTDGDTIEIRGNGPFVTERITINHPLRIRAGAGFRPVITDDPRHTPPKDAWLLFVESPLVLEGLDLQAGAEDQNLFQAVAPVCAANCRFLKTSGFYAIQVQRNATLKNCQIVSANGVTVDMYSVSSALHVSVENCVLVGDINLDDMGNAGNASFQLKNSTVVAPRKVSLLFVGRGAMQQGSAQRPIQILASNNVLDPSGTLFFFCEGVAPQAVKEASELESLLTGSFTWREERNLYRIGPPYLAVGWPGTSFAAPARSLSEWNKFWGMGDTGSREGTIRYRGGDLHARAVRTSEQLTPDDFRLRPDSAGYRAGPDGKDLGADVDLVGPGKAYERWKQSPAYQEWQTATIWLLRGDKRPERD